MAEKLQSMSRKMLKREVESLHQEIVKLRQKVGKISGNQELERPRSVLGIDNMGNVTEGDFKRALNPLKQDLADLALAINRLTSKGPLMRPQKSHRKLMTESEVVYRVRLKGKVKNRTVTIRNRGQEVVVKPKIIINGKRNWFSTSSVLEEVLKSGMPKKEVAIAIWKFLKDNRFHYTPAHDHIEMHDPIKFLNVYGYGFCDDSATNFMVLAEQAGLKARVWGLEGHVVPEVHFQGAWHMLDPDGEIYYLNDDESTISSVKTLEQRPDIIRRYPSPFYTDAEKLVEIYTTTEDNRVVPFYKEKSEARHTMGYILRPGESLMRSWNNWGIYFSSRFLDEPKEYGNGRWLFEPIFEGELFRRGAESVRGLRVEAADSGCVLVPSYTGRPGSLIYRFSSPYPFLDGKVNLVGEIQKKGQVSIAFSETKESWLPVWSTNTIGKVKMEIPTGGYFRNGYGEPFYNYFLKVTLSASKGGSVQLNRLWFSSDIQLAPHSLPSLEPGLNEVRYVDESSGQINVEILFSYDSVDHQ